MFTCSKKAGGVKCKIVICTIAAKGHHLISSFVLNILMKLDKALVPQCYQESVKLLIKIQ